MMSENEKQRIKLEAEQVRMLGEKIGYGNLMEFASALWRKSLEEKGYPTSGAFIPTIGQCIEKEMFEKTINERKAYDAFVRF
jgi:hypothetical protein